MLSLSRVLFLLIGSLSISDAKVEFTSSTMYDIYDFQGVDVIRLDRCDNGCLIFASAIWNFNTPDGLDPYMKSVTVFDPATNTAKSISELAMQYDAGTSQKVPLDITAKGQYSILNLNQPNEKGTDVAVWVIERAKAHEFDYEIFDAAAMNRRPAIPSQIVTIMSAAPFTVIGKNQEPNAFTARLVGFDNALNNNADACASVFDAPDIAEFDGYEFQVNSPIISLVFASNKNSVDFTANFNHINIRRMSKPGFMASPGYNGCARLGDQVYRNTGYHYSEQIELHGEPDFYRVVFDTISDLSPNHSIDVGDAGRDVTLEGPYHSQHFEFPDSQLVLVRYKDITAPQSFLLRYTTSLPAQETTPVPGSPTKPDSTMITATQVTPTTSAVRGVTPLASLSFVLALLFSC